MTQISKKYSSSTVTFEDNMAVALEQLLYAMIHYNPDRGAFTTYFYHRLWGCIRHSYQRQERCICPSNSEAEMLTLQENKMEIDLPMFVDELLSCLNPYQRKVIESYFLKNLTLREIEAITNTSYTTVQTNREKALKKIRVKFPKEEKYV